MKEKIIEVTYSKDNKTVEIEDPWLGKRTIENTFLATIKDQLNLLNHFKNDGREPSELLLQDIRLYEFILNNPDKEKMAKTYMGAQNLFKGSKRPYKKIDICKFLEWDIE